MSYKTLDVELENSLVRPAGSESLPAKAHALMTILSSAPSAAAEAPAGSLADLVQDFCRIGNGSHTDLSTNKGHLDDFGK
jgi:hypothetical protein